MPTLTPVSSVTVMVTGAQLDTLSEGDHTVRVEATDEAGNVGSAEVSFTVDALPPTIIITSPASGATNKNTPLLSYTVSDGTVVVMVDGTTVDKVSGNTLDLLNDGLHAVRIDSTDTRGRFETASVNFTVDTVAPVVTMSSPAAGVTNVKTQLLTYTVSDGNVAVTDNDAPISTRSGGTLTLADGTHTIKVTATDAATNAGSAQVTLTVDTTPPAINIWSPVAGTTNLTSVPLDYSVSDGDVTVTFDGVVTNMASGGTLSNLANGSHTVRIDATDAAGNPSHAIVNFTVDTASAGNDDTNIYCKGTGTYVVGASGFTSGISVPAGGNTVMIASPIDGGAISGPNAIVKGAMDTTIPVSSVTVMVTGASGTSSTVAQVNGNYFAAKVPVAADTYTISAIATDQTGTQHLATIAVFVTAQQNAADLSASPSVGIPLPKDGGSPSLDVYLTSSATTTAPITSYAWDFEGTGANDVTCYSHSNVAASYQQTGLYLTKVTIADAAGNAYTDSAIVNVMDRGQADSIFKSIWNGMKAKLGNQDIEGAVSFFGASAQDRYRTIFTALNAILPQMAQDMQDIQLVYVNEGTAMYRIHKNEMYGGQTISMTYYIYFTQDQNGMWTIEKF